jgi:hypothetical protein
MNYYAARQRQDGRWDYTCMNDGRIWPVGYCMPYKEWWIDLKEKMGYETRPEEIARYQAHQAQYHADGHATAEEACECYRQYLLDHKVQLNRSWDGGQFRCQVCGEWTQLFAEVDHQTFNLCEKHNTQEQVGLLFGPIGEICSSY